MVRIDAHCHFWKLSRGDYDWLDASNPSLATIARDFLPSDIAPFIQDAGVQHVVMVQTAANEAETDYMLTLANNRDEIAGVVGWADIESGDATKRLEKWAVDPKFKGIRPMMQNIDDAQWLLERPNADVFTAMVDLGIRFDALVQPRHLSVLHKFCTSNPMLPVVIDHAAKPKAALAGNADAFSHWARHMQSIARDTNTYCKISGLLTELDANNPTNQKDMLQRYVDVLLEAFGPDRLMWGSDWPVLTLVSDYQQWHTLVEALLGHIEPDARDQIFGGTAGAFYGIGVAP